MTREPERGFLAALDAVARALEETSAPSMVIGGVAVIALGIARLTIDIDATVWAAQVDLGLLAEALARHGIRPRIEGAMEFARSRHVFLGLHEPSGTPVDVSLAWLPFEEEAIRASSECDYGGVRIRIPRPEDLVLYKLIAARPKDVEDAETLLLLYGHTMDLDRVRETVRDFAEVLGDRTRPELFETLVRKTGLKG